MTLTVQVPIYHGGVVPATVEGRRGAFAGWVGLAFDPQVLLQRALADRPHTAVTLVFRDTVTPVRFASGQPAPGSQLNTIDLDDGWSVEVLGAAREPSVFADRSAILVLGGGILTSVLFAALVMVLGTGRARAWRLVGERTGELQHQALHDSLTDLPNRALIIDRIDQLLARNRRHGTAGAALYLDLDDFKNVNDTLGHAAGDHLLVAVAARLRTALREADTIGRMGGDEFVVLIDDVTLEATVLVAQRLMNVMHQPYELDAALMPMTINTSVGIAIGDRPSAGDLLRDADVALYQAKAAGKNRYEIFCSELQSQVSRRIDIEFELRSAIDSGQMRLVYQPIYNLDDLSLVGVEALLRWSNPKLGDVEPDEFIPILEQSGHIQEVGRWVLQTACTQMARWRARGDDVKLSVNVSARQLDHDDIVEHIRRALVETGLEPSALIVEVTETALMRNAEATAVRLAAIKALGVSIAVDDFGTGYSSLAYLQQFPVDCLKIDRRFTHAIEMSPESRALVNTLVQLGKDLGLRTLAEGVESTAEIEHLRRENVDQAQGFLLSRPLDPMMLEAVILEPLRCRPLSSDPT
jgi:diguanylate cyclase (GGDEF)-like protein